MRVPFIFRIIKDPLFVALNVDRESCVDQRFGIFGRESGSTLKLFLFAAEPEVLGHGCLEERKV